MHKYCKRIGMLYLCWFIIDFWFIWTKKPYFHVSILDGISLMLKDVIFATTFPGSWYLSASIVGVLLVYLLNKCLHPAIVFILSYLLASYVYYINSVPESLQVPYILYATYFRDEVNLSFPAQMVWISAGQLLSLVMVKLDKNKKIYRNMSILIFILVFCLSMFFSSLELTLVLASSLVIFCFLTNLPQSPLYKLIRNYSILMFFFHFSIAGKMSYFTQFVGDTLFTNWLYYLIVIGVSIIFAHTVLMLEDKKYFKFLKYLH